MTSVVHAPLLPSRSRVGRIAQDLGVRRLAVATLKRSAAIVVFLLLWELAPRIGLINKTFLPPFSEVIAAGWRYAIAGKLWPHVEVSFGSAFGGFALGVVTAVPLGIVLGWYSTIVCFDKVNKSFGVQQRLRNDGPSPVVTALQDIDLSVEPGEFFVLVGESGSGKSTLLDLATGLAKPTSGRIFVDGVPVTGPVLERGVFFQQYALFLWKTAIENVAFGLEAKGVPRRPCPPRPATSSTPSASRVLRTVIRTSCRAA